MTQETSATITLRMNLMFCKLLVLSFLNLLLNPRHSSFREGRKVNGRESKLRAVLGAGTEHWEQQDSQ